jgi:hypothetical protein
MIPRAPSPAARAASASLMPFERVGASDKFAEVQFTRLIERDQVRRAKGQGPRVDSSRLALCSLRLALCASSPAAKASVREDVAPFVSFPEVWTVVQGLACS